MKSQAEDLATRLSQWDLRLADGSFANHVLGLVQAELKEAAAFIRTQQELLERAVCHIEHDGIRNDICTEAGIDIAALLSAEDS